MTFEAIMNVAEVVTPLLVLVGGWQIYKKQLRKEATSVAISYRFTIDSINEHLEQTSEVLNGIMDTLVALPSKTVSDYRKEDWFDVHRELSDHLGYLYHLDEKKGTEANRMIMQFFNRLKYVRDVWSYLIMLAGAVGPVSLEVEEGDDLGTKLAKRDIKDRMPRLKEKLKELIDLGKDTVKILNELVPLDKSAPVPGTELQSSQSSGDSLLNSHSHE